MTVNSGRFLGPNSLDRTVTYLIIIIVILSPVHY